MVFVTQALFYGLCWLEWGGRQAVLFHITERKFYIFGMVFWPQDVIYLAVLLVISAYGLFLVTAVGGRLFCGYACPQTVYTEILMWIERKIEGERPARMKLDAQPMNLRASFASSSSNIRCGCCCPVDRSHLRRLFHADQGTARRNRLFRTGALGGFLDIFLHRPSST
ncbi:4Fe-4S binding protein [Candidatus Accumulibacter contiguus]|uniref:4Fe-4S binding protein n=1 Tax=Candidatus Accumulibacter contiguus TaxID=2954381 RepID=UPI002FC3775A